MWQGKIYIITNNIDAKVYVGRTIQKIETRWANHKADSRRKNGGLHLAMAEYGVDNFEITHICSVKKEALDELERHFIKSFNSQYPNGYNYACGGLKDFTHADCTKVKMKLMREGYKHSDETKLKQSRLKMGKPSSRKGCKISPAQREALMKANLGKKLSLEHKCKIGERTKGEKNPFFGKKHSEETKKKMREFRLGRKASSEHKLKISEGNLKRWAKIKKELQLA